MATSILATVAWVPGVWAALHAELILIVVVDTVAWASVVALTLARTLPYRLRAGLFIGLTATLGLVLLLVLGAVGAGQVWLTFFPVVTAIFFGLRGAFLSLGALLAVCLAYGAGVWLVGLEPLAGPLAGPGYTVFSWGATAGSMLFLASVLAISAAHLLGGLDRALGEAREAGRRLEDSNRDLARAMDEQRTLEARLAEARRTEALGTLAGGIAHDFNNLLVPILSRAEAVRADLPESDPRREELDDIVGSAIRGRDMVRRILAYARGSDGTPLPVSVDPMVREVCRMVGREAPTGVGIVLELAAGEALVQLDPAELHQVLTNLVTNAFRAMEAVPTPPGPDGHRLQVVSEADDDEVRLRVSDSGGGMTAEVRERAFDPFFTTDTQGRGTGLGLPTVRRVVREAGGTIEVQSAPGQGTTVELHLPRLTLQAAGATPGGEGAGDEGAGGETSGNETSGTGAAPAAPGGAPDLHGARSGGPGPRPAPAGAEPHHTPIHVLVVDDDATVRRTVSALLRRSGFHVTETGTGAEALAHLDEADVLLTDHSMPGMTGIELAREVARRRPIFPSSS